MLLEMRLRPEFGYDSCRVKLGGATWVPSREEWQWKEENKGETLGGLSVFGEELDT